MWVPPQKIGEITGPQPLQIDEIWITFGRLGKICVLTSDKQQIWVPPPHESIHPSDQYVSERSQIVQRKLLFGDQTRLAEVIQKKIDRQMLKHSYPAIKIFFFIMMMIIYLKRGCYHSRILPKERPLLVLIIALIQIFVINSDASIYT